MKNENYRILECYSDFNDFKRFLSQNNELIQDFVFVIHRFYSSLKQGGRVIFALIGGSAADAQHLAAEFVSRFKYDRPGLPALSLAADSSMISAIDNDYGYERLLVSKLQAQARSGDVFVGITTSGKSVNMLRAFEICNELQGASVALCQLDGQLEGLVDYILRSSSNHTPRIQECHILTGHMICAEVELHMFGHLAPNRI
jgi:D-sedoheptulose 7-phosphate isomerase